MAPSGARGAGGTHRVATSTTSRVEVDDQNHKRFLGSRCTKEKCRENVKLFASRARYPYTDIKSLVPVPKHGTMIMGSEIQEN